MKRSLLFTACLAFGLSTSPAAEPWKPNIILFLVDDMGWMDSEPYGSQYYDTPNMERLATQSMRFTSAYAVPLCSPTRASILTGQYSSRHGITTAGGHTPPRERSLPESMPPNHPLLMPQSQTYLDPAQYTLAEALRDAGYRTGHFGKWHLGLEQEHWPEAHGFDNAFHSEPSAGPPGQYFSPYQVYPPGVEKPRMIEGRRTYSGTITDGPDGEYITDRLTEEALQFIADCGDQPFFLNLWHYGVHGPWAHKESLTAELAKRTDPRGVQDNPIMASMLKSVDESLGRILDKLDELELAKDTLVIFYSDNGGNTTSMTKKNEKGARGDATNPVTASYRKWAGYKPPTDNTPLRAGKGRHYEGGIRVPLMVRWPGKIAPGTTSDAVVGCIDLYPTILDALGMQPAETQTIDGESLLPVLTQSGNLQRKAYFTWFPHIIPGVSVRQGDWKLIRRFTERPEDYEGLHELFNLREDLSETTNLATKMPDKVKELDALIDAFVKDTDTLYPQPNPAYKPRPSTRNTQADPMRGLIARFCMATLTDGALRIESNGRAPFLSTTQVRIAGPLTLTLRLRSRAGGAGKVQWKTAEQEAFPESGQAVDFTVSASSEWQDIKVKLHIDSRPGILRLYLPAQQAPLEVQAIQFSNDRAEMKAWAFQTTRGE